jgi:hypothetical protein
MAAIVWVASEYALQREELGKHPSIDDDSAEESGRTGNNSCVTADEKGAFELSDRTTHKKNTCDQAES